MRHSLWLGSLALLLLTACASQKLYKAGVTDDEKRRDAWECEQQVLTMYGGLSHMGAGHAVVARGDMVRCLVARGYRVVSSDEAAALRAGSVSGPATNNPAGPQPTN